MTDAETTTTDAVIESEESGAAGSDDSRSEGDPGGSDRIDLLEQEGEYAADYVEALLDIADLDGDIDMDVEGERAAVSVIGSGLSALVGRNGEVLEAMQELTRMAVQRRTGERSRLMLDIGGHRARVRERLTELAKVTAKTVRDTDQPVALKAMTPFERKVVHDAVGSLGLRSESEGVEPNRHVVVLPR